MSCGPPSMSTNCAGNGGERPLTIAEQMKVARQQAQEQRGPEAPKKDTPDRGER